MTNSVVTMGQADTRTATFTNKVGTPLDVNNCSRTTDKIDETWELHFTKRNVAGTDKYYVRSLAVVSGARRDAEIAPSGTSTVIIPGFSIKFAATINDGDYAHVQNTAYFIANTTPPS